MRRFQKSNSAEIDTFSSSDDGKRSINRDSYNNDDDGRQNNVLSVCSSNSSLSSNSSSDLSSCQN